MSRTNTDVEDQACAAVMRQVDLKTKRDAVNLAPHSLAPEPFSIEEALKMRGSGWDGDLDEMRGRGAGAQTSVERGSAAGESTQRVCETDLGQD